MNTIRKLINDVSYQNLEKFVNLVYEGGEDATYLGYPCFSGKDSFIIGALVEHAITLFIYYTENNDEHMASESVKKINCFLDMVATLDMKSWGEFSILKALVQLKKKNLFHIIDEKYIDMLKEKTDYDDIVDKKTADLLGWNTNYYHVAMACAGLRHILGWEDAVMRDKIADRLYAAMSGYSSYGWMDENFPNGRFDRYSILIGSEIADTLRRLDMPIPENILNYLKMSADAMLKMINSRGDGVCYGRSLSTHGDAAASEVLSTALACGIIDKKDVDKAVWYSITSINKLLNFWYDSELETFNIWLKGRTTNGYRHLHRILELNLDMFGGHLLNTLHNFEEAGLADYIPNFKYTAPDKWTVDEIVFDERDYIRKAFVLKRGEHMFTLPLIGCGDYIHWSAYLPFPVSSGLVEAPPEFFMPYLTPLITFKDGSTAMPVQYFDKIDVAEGDDKIEITAHLRTLACADDKNPSPVAQSECTTTYIFEKNTIGATFDIKTDKEIRNIEMQFAHSGILKATAIGMDIASEENIDGNENYFTTHGGMNKLITWKSGSASTIGYKIEF